MKFYKITVKDKVNISDPRDVFETLIDNLQKAYDKLFDTLHAKYKNVKDYSLINDISHGFGSNSDITFMKNVPENYFFAPELFDFDKEYEEYKMHADEINNIINEYKNHKKSFNAAEQEIKNHIRIINRICLGYDIFNLKNNIASLLSSDQNFNDKILSYEDFVKKYNEIENK